MSDPSLQDTYSTIRIPLVNVSEGGIQHLGNASMTNQLFVNCLPTQSQHPVTGESEYYLQKRPGLDQVGTFDWSSVVGSGDLTPKANIGFTQLSDVNVCAFHRSTDNKIYIVQYQPSAGSALVIGSFNAVSSLDFVYLNEMMVGTTELPALSVIWCASNFTTSKGYTATSSAGLTGSFTAASLALITDVAFPANVANEVCVGPMQQLNSYFYQMTRSGKIYQCQAAYNIVSWSTNRIIETYSYPDKGVGLIRYKHHLVAFSETTIEFFNDSGARGDGSTVSCSLERTEQAFIKFGALNAKCIKNIDDILYWVASSDTSTTGVWKMDGYTPVKISTFREDAMIQESINSASEFYLDTFSLQGTKQLILGGVSASMYVPQFTTGSPSDNDPWTSTMSGIASILCYSIESKGWWYIWEPYFAGGGVGFTWLPAAYFNRNASYNFYSQYFLKGIPGGGGDTKLYQLDPSGFIFYDVNDTATTPVPVPMYFQTNTLDSGTGQVKNLRRLELIHDSPDKDQPPEINPTIAPWHYLVFNRRDGYNLYPRTYTGSASYASTWKGIKTTLPRSDMLYAAPAAYTDAGMNVQGSSKWTIGGWFRRGGSLTAGPISVAFPFAIATLGALNIGYSLRLVRNDGIPALDVQLTINDSAGLGTDTHTLIWRLPQSGPFWTDWVHWAWQIDLSQPLAGKIKFYQNFVLQPNLNVSTITATSLPNLWTSWWVGKSPDANYTGSGTAPDMANVTVWNNQIVPIEWIQRCAYVEEDVGASFQQNWDIRDVAPTIWSVTSDIQIATPGFARTYMNNLGQYRRADFGVFTQNPYPGRYKALELTVMMGR